jgi:type I restriction enzyme S subunit
MCIDFHEHEVIMAKKNSKKTVPELRFRGFTDPWEQRQLGEVAEVHNGRDYKHLQPGNIPVYGTSGYMLSVDDALSWNDDAVGIGRKGTIDKPCILRAPFWTVDTLFFVTPRSSTPLEFLFTLFESVNWKSKDESTGVPSLTKQAIVNTAVKVPDTSEQHRIGAFFSTLDSLIAAAERQEALLRQKKQAYLQLMFPREGETEPRLRFKGSSGQWHQRQLGELYTPSREKNDGSFSAKDIISVAGMRYASRESSNSTDDYMRTYNVMRVGDIAFEGNRSGNFSHGRFVENDLGDGIVSHVFVVLRPLPGRRYDLAFWKEAIHDEFLMKRILARSTKRSTMMHEIVVPDFLKEVVAVPSLSEQQQIGKFFSTFDSLIAAAEQRTRALKEMKSAYLQRMFV